MTRTRTRSEAVPKVLDAGQKRIYGRLRTALDELGVWRPEFADSLAELVQLRRIQADSLARWQEQPTVSGSMGQMIENPALRTYMAAQDRAHKLAESLFLTPRSRARAGIKEPEDDGLDAILGD